MKNKKLVLKSKWQKVLEVLVALSLMLIVSTADSEWSTGYFVFLGIQVLVFVGSAKVIEHFGDTSKYQ